MYPKVMAQTEPKCNLCGSCMSKSYWNDGSSDAKKPRMIHGFNDIVYLVSAVFVCDKRHKMLAHEESILQVLLRSLIPFILSHQTGFTKELFDLCTMLQKGNKLFITWSL